MLPRASSHCFSSDEPNYLKQKFVDQRLTGARMLEQQSVFLIIR